MPQDAAAPTVGASVQVQYRPGLAGGSRLVGHDHLIVVALFLLGIAGGLVVLSVRMAEKAPTPHREPGMFDRLAQQ